MNLLGILANLIGIGKEALSRRADKKKLLAIQEHEIIKAETIAKVNNINKNTDADNAGDIIAIRQMEKSWKDDIITYLWTSPIAVAIVVPFIQANKAGEWGKLNEFTLKSWQGLNELPDWYKYILIIIIIATFGFRSMLRRAIDAWVTKTFTK